MSPEVALMAKHFRANAEADAATGLDAPPHGDKVRHCTKMVCMVAGGQDELPWAVRVAIGQGNGKPFMVNRTGFFTKREDKGYFEIGVNAHNFGPVVGGALLLHFTSLFTYSIMARVGSTSEALNCHTTYACSTQLHFTHVGGERLPETYD